ncbi:MAG TPA: DapH/DapD/GlmU-related protein, partial [Segetibacter sp.]|nr:DapH/DapD/GlmU-related protein [Segetibacter sp.]
NQMSSVANSPVISQAGIVDVTFGENVKVVEPVNLYGCSIGNHSFIGPFVEIQRGVVIGEKCKIQSHSFICELVIIGDHCFVGHGVMFINDLLAKDFLRKENVIFGNLQLLVTMFLLVVMQHCYQLRFAVM